MNSKWLSALIARFAARLRFPQLFMLTAALFAIDLIVPDFLPFADEILLGLATLLLGTWQRERTGRADDRERSDGEEDQSDAARFARARRVGPAGGTNASRP